MNCSSCNAETEALERHIECAKCQELGWVGHPSCEDAGDGERLLIANRSEIEKIAEIQDENASYSYDDFALIRFRGDFYLLQTSGCSCPSRSETWGIDIGPATLDEIEAFLKSGRYEGYTVPGRQMGEFLAAIAQARALEVK